MTLTKSMTPSDGVSNRTLSFGGDSRSPALTRSCTQGQSSSLRRSRFRRNSAHSWLEVLIVLEQCRAFLPFTLRSGQPIDQIWPMHQVVLRHKGAGHKQNSGCPDRRAGQDRETPKFGDKTTFILPATGAACQTSAPRRVLHCGVPIAPRLELVDFLRVVQRGPEVV
jgi:hypothetical protein